MAGSTAGGKKDFSPSKRDSPDGDSWMRQQDATRSLTTVVQSALEEFLALRGFGNVPLKLHDRNKTVLVIFPVLCEAHTLEPAACHNPRLARYFI